MKLINSFLLTKLTLDEYALLNHSNIILLTDKKMIKFLEKIEEEQIKAIDEDYIKDYFQDDYETACSFLLDNKITSEKTDLCSILKINILCNDYRITECLKYNLVEESNLKISYFRDVEDLYRLELSSTCCFFVLNPFNLTLLEKITKYIQEEDITSKVCFLYNMSFYITNLYNKKWYNPCPLCFISNLEASLRGEGKIYNTTSFQTIIDLIYSKNINFNIEMKLSKSDILFIISSIFEEIKHMKWKYINSVRKIDFKNCKIENDTAYHWELCDCYE